MIGNSRMKTEIEFKLARCASSFSNWLKVAPEPYYRRWPRRSSQAVWGFAKPCGSPLTQRRWENVSELTGNPGRG